MTALLQIPEIQPENVEPVEVPFGEWLPDQPELNNPGAVEALNVIPSEGSYSPFPQHEPEEGAILPDTVRGAAAVINSSDVTQIYIATSSTIYLMTGSVLTAMTTGMFSPDYLWQFFRVNDQMIALHPDLQPIKHEVGTVNPLSGVGGNPPRAAAGAQVGDFLMLGNLFQDPDDGNGVFPSRVRWGGFNNIDLPWVTDPVTQADFQDMPAEGGPVVAISGRETATIFQARLISRGRYIGPTKIFEFAVAEDKRGCIARDSVVDVGPYKFFIAEDGFFIWNGTNSVPIGDSRVNRYFFNRLEFSRRNYIVGAPDFVNGCVMWAFPIDTSGVMSEIIIYSYRDNKWSHSEQVIDYLLSSAASNVTLEDLTDPLESYTISFDDPSLRRGGRSRLAAFNQQHQYGLYTGTPMAATIDTGEFSGPGSRRVTTNSVRPLVDLATPVASVQAIGRDQMIGQPIEISDSVAQEVDGQCPILADARYMRFRVNLPLGASWDHAVGVEVMRKAGGQF